MKRNLIASLSAIAMLGFAACAAPESTVNRNAAPTTSTTTNAPMTTSASPMASASPMTSENPMVGGAAMYANKDIVDNAVNSKDHTTLVKAVTAAGLVDTLKGAGPFTVFAPTNAAFEELPAGTVDTLLKPANKAALTKVLTYHVVPGKQDAATIAKAITDGGGKATFKTVEGGTLTASMNGNDVIITDAKGGTAKVTTANVMQSNGVIHVVDGVLMHN
ncbi:MAG: fasciclin domain-containing protein [Pyrinomonadaceae bacterium MAG19_C2-C3]|nr:fasciclin domain-containing protein [Pyrinomonadaceae bacterium MAG19_C2-C3]